MSNTIKSQIPIQNSKFLTPQTIQNPSQPIPVSQQLQSPNWIPQQSTIIPQQVLPNTYMPSNSYISQIPQTQYVPQIQSQVIGVTQGEIIKGESRIEYVPYTKEVTEYVTQEVIEYVPRERKITDYYAIEYFTEVIPQVIQEKYIEYVPIETVKERTEYQAIYKQQVIEQPQQYQEIQYTEQPITTYIQQPQQQQYIANTIYYEPQYSQTKTQQYYQTFSPSVQPTIPISQSPSFIIQPSIGTTAWQPIIPGSIKNLSSGQRLNGSIVPNTRGSFIK